jgi:hypothetical protein
MEILEFLTMAPAKQVKALEELTKAAARVAELEAMLKKSRGREHWMAIGGRAEDWDTGLGEVATSLMTWNDNLQPSLDLEAHPAMKRHLNIAPATGTNSRASRSEAWNDATAAREARFPRPA